MENCDNDGPEVTIHFSNDNPATSGVFYIPVAPDNYNDIQVKIVGADGTVLMEKECDPCTIERCDLKKIIIE